MFASFIDIYHVVLGCSTPTWLMPCIENKKQHLILGINLQTSTSNDITMI